MAGTSSSAVTPIETWKDLISNLHQDGSKLVVLEFTAQWSEPSKSMVQPFEEVASKFQDKVKFYTIDFDKCKEQAQQLRVEALPTFLLVKKFWVKKRYFGASKEDLEKAINSVLTQYNSER